MKIVRIDLPELKAQLSPLIKTVTEPFRPSSVSVEIVDALVARLEAAEACIIHDTDQCEYEHQGCHECKLVKAWRKHVGNKDAQETL